MQRRALVAALLFPVLGMPVSAVAGGPLAGEAITYVVATKPGGGYDTVGRLVARHMPKYLDGATMDVQNVPGGGHVIGALKIFQSEPDGLTIGTFNTGLVYSQVLGELQEPLDLAKMSWIGKATVESRGLLASKQSGFKTIADMQKAGRKIKFVSNGLKSASHYDALLLIHVFGLDAEVIPGFEGTEAELSMMRGEVDAHVSSVSSVGNFVKEGHGQIILEIGGEADSPYPQAKDLADTPEAQPVFALIEAQARISRLTAGPPGIPADRLAALRDAYTRAMGDKDLLAEAKALGLTVAPLAGGEVEKLIQQALALPPEKLALIRGLLRTP